MLERLRIIFPGAEVARRPPGRARSENCRIVLSREAVGRLLRAVDNTKHRAILMLVYSAGLRVSEVVGLRPDDLDEERGLIHVHGGKGRKDRYTVLSNIALQAVKIYQAVYPRGMWLFPGAEPAKHLTAYSGEFDHLFRFKSTSQSDSNRPDRSEATMGPDWIRDPFPV